MNEAKASFRAAKPTTQDFQFVSHQFNEMTKMHTKYNSIQKLQQGLTHSIVLPYSIVPWFCREKVLF